MSEIVENNECQGTTVILWLCGAVGFSENEPFRNVTGTRGDLCLRINYCLKKFVSLVQTALNGCFKNFI